MARNSTTSRCILDTSLEAWPFDLFSSSIAVSPQAKNPHPYSLRGRLTFNSVTSPPVPSDSITDPPDSATADVGFHFQATKNSPWRSDRQTCANAPPLPPKDTIGGPDAGGTAQGGHRPGYGHRTSHAGADQSRSGKDFI